MGTPQFAVPSLNLLAGRLEVRAVITQPDRPAGRGGRFRAPPVKRAAADLGLDVYQPERIRDPAAFERLAGHAPDAITVVGFGQFIPKRIRELAPFGCVNVHASLLPNYRGAAPVQWAIANGETRTGVTTMRISRELDAGDILLARESEIGPDETAPSVDRRLARIGAELLVETLDGLEAGTIRPAPQDHAAATAAPMLRREDGLAAWRSPAVSIYNRLRGFDPWPGIFTHFRGKRLRIWSARPLAAGGLEPGEIRLSDGGFSVGCGSGSLAVSEVQMEGGKRVGAADFARGARPRPGEVLGDA